MKIIIFALIAYACGNTVVTLAQTVVSGGIYTNTTWTQTNSPYIVTGDIVLFPDMTLTIEPGVSVQFDGFYKLEIRGKLVAIGTANDSIRFVSNTSQNIAAWKGVDVLNSSQNASGFFDHCVFRHGAAAVAIECCWGNNSTYIKNSFFSVNDIGVYGYAGWDLMIDNCVFTNNTYGIFGGDNIITNSTFIANDTGMDCDRFEVRNCYFQNHTTAIYVYSGGSESNIIDSCTILYNHIGIESREDIITNCNISENNYGIKTDHSSSTVNGIQYFVPIKNNMLCHNTIYNIENLNDYNKNITQNCFCIEDSAAIEEKLKDGYDDITLGLFNYDIYDTLCQVVTRSVYKIGDPPAYVTEIFPNDLNLLVYPNPFNVETKLEAPNHVNNATMIVLNCFGKTVAQLDNINGSTIVFNRNDLPSGLYFVQLKENNKIIASTKLVITD
jgi:hypothetical protein